MGYGLWTMILHDDHVNCIYFTCQVEVQSFGYKKIISLIELQADCDDNDICTNQVLTSEDAELSIHNDPDISITHQSVCNGE